jgi:hypothetical protein
MNSTTDSQLIVKHWLSNKLIKDASKDGKEAQEWNYTNHADVTEIDEGRKQRGRCGTQTILLAAHGQSIRAAEN